MPRITVGGYSVRKFGDQRVIDVTVALTGASSGAEGGNTGASIVTGRVSPSPFIFTTQGKSFTPKGVGEISTGLSAAQASAQTQGLLGANVTIYIDGAEARTGAGVITFEMPTGGASGAVGGFGAMNYADGQKQKDKKKRLAELMRQLYEMSNDE